MWYTSAQRLADTHDWRNNVVLYGILEDKDLSLVSDVLQTVAGSQIAAC